MQPNSISNEKQRILQPLIVVTPEDSDDYLPF
jgi:hypothetical protein